MHQKREWSGKSPFSGLKVAVLMRPSNGLNEHLNTANLYSRCGSNLVSDIGIEVSDYLKARGASFVSEVVAVPGIDSVYVHVPESVIAKKAGRDKTSRRQLTYLRKALQRDLHVIAEFVIVSDLRERIESGLSGLLKKQVGDHVINCFVSSLEGAEVDVMLEFDMQLSSLRVRPEVERLVREYLNPFDLRLRSIDFGSSEENIPSLVELLAAMKRSEPALISDIRAALHDQDDSYPSDSWLAAKLDLLRKRGLILRDRDGRYVLTLEGLTALPHKRGRNSTDIVRDLALGRKSWL